MWCSFKTLDGKLTQFIATFLHELFVPCQSKIQAYFPTSSASSSSTSLDTFDRRYNEGAQSVFCMTDDSLKGGSETRAFSLNPPGCLATGKTVNLPGN